MNLRYAAIIPARAGSLGVPGKNVRPLAGKPLIVWSIEAARASRRVADVVVTSDGPEILRVAAAAGAQALERPPALATAAAPTEPALIHAVEWLIGKGRRPDAVILLQPTSPVRRAGAVDRAIARFEETGADSLVSACETHAFHWKNLNAPEALYDYRRRPRRQDIAPNDRWYRENGSIYMTRTDLLLREKNRLGGRLALFLMAEEESVEIDSEIDFLVNEKIMERESVK